MIAIALIVTIRMETPPDWAALLPVELSSCPGTGCHADHMFTIKSLGFASKEPA